MTLCRILFALALAFAAPVLAQEAAPTPLLNRINMVTVATPDAAQAEKLYSEWLGYTVREKGKVSDALAKSWGAPKVAGHPYVVFSNDADPDVFLRAVQSDPVEGYKPMTTFGWNAFELIIDDVYKAHDKMAASPFAVIGGPSPLKSAPSIVTLQIRGPAGEIFYMANETGDRTKSSLPNPGTLIGRPFIVILAGQDITAVRDTYADTFAMTKASIRQSGGRVVPDALGLPEGSSLPISLLALKEPGNRIQLDGYLDYGKGARPRAPGQLPPGNAMVSFSVANIDAVKANFITPPAQHDSKAYGGKRSATFVGPAGELVELIEEARP